MFCRVAPLSTSALMLSGFFEQALLLNQNDPNLWNNKGIALRSLGRYEEAMECFNKSLEIDPRDKNAS